MPTLKKNLPNEHGGWVLFCTGVIAGVAINPGWWQIPAALGWMGFFFLRVPLTRLLTKKGKSVAVKLVIGAGLCAIAGFGATAVGRIESVAWAAAAAPVGLILIVAGNRRFLRGLAGEILSMVAMLPLIPSIAVAGNTHVPFGDLLFIAAALGVYLLASVFRVRAVARMGRKKAEWWELTLGAAFLPFAFGVAIVSDVLGVPVIWGSVPVLLIGAGMVLASRRNRIGLMKVGLLETAAVIPFALGLIMNFAPYLET